MDRRLDSLEQLTRFRMFEFLARLTEANIPVMIINTLRTKEEQEKNIANGASWTPNSKHLVGKAVDICPYAIYQEHGDKKLQWDSNDPIWEKIGQIGEKCGLKWGGRWTQKDMGHFEI